MKGPFGDSEEHRETVHSPSGLQVYEQVKGLEVIIETLKENRAMWEGSELEKEEHTF